MFRSLIFLIVLLISSNLIAQNVGQVGDTLINYTDINGDKQGFWKKEYPNGKLMYEGYFRNNLPVGTFKRYYDTGQLKAEMKYDMDGVLCRSKLYYKSKKIAAEGNYINQKKDSIWNYYAEYGVKIYVENYKNGVLNGLVEKYFWSGKGKCEEIIFVDGKMDGPWIHYFENGSKKMIANHKMGVRTGEFLSYYTNGNKRLEGVYEKGLKHGEWIFYNEDGSIKKRVEFVKDKAVNQNLIDDELSKEIKEAEENKERYEEPEQQIMKMLNGMY